MMYLSWILKWFETIFGFKITLEKSELILIGGVSDVEALLAVSGDAPTHVFASPFENILQIEGGLGHMAERFQRRLAMWKLQYLTKGGVVNSD